MNKYTLALIFCIISLATNAKTITLKQAQNKVISFLKTKHRATRSSASLTNDVKEVNINNNACYVFNVGQNNGFVIVSNDDITDDILGYTTSGNFDANNIPDNVEWILDAYEAQLSILKQNKMQENQTRVVKKREPLEPLIKTMWNQDGPYNLQCPKYFNELSVTGCVATTMAQLMYYHKWPIGFTTEIPAYTTRTARTEVEKLDSTRFNWGIMKQSYNYNDNDQSAQEVAKLMRYCGQSVKMDYTSYNSLTYVQNEMFSKYFKFNADNRIIDRNNFTSSNWEEIIYNEIKAKRPVFYTGGKISGYHAFICDGYDEDGNFHINWGWGGRYNGYFKLSILNPSGNGIGGASGEDGYTLNQQAIINLHAPGMNSDINNSETRLTIKQFTLKNGKYTRATKNDEFDLSSAYAVIYNSTMANKNAKVAIALYKDNNQYAILSQSENLNFASLQSYYKTFPIKINSNIENGKYKLMVVCKPENENKWQLSIDAEKRYYDIEVSDLELNVKAVGSSSGKLTINDIKTEGNLTSGSVVNFHINLSNNTSVNNPVLYMFVNNQIVSQVSSNIDPQTTGDVLMRFAPPKEGTYKIEIYRDADKYNLLKSINIDIKKAEIANLEMHHEVTNSNTDNTLPNNSLKLKITITNKNNTPYNNVVLVNLCRQKKGRVYSYTEKRRIDIYLLPNETTTLDLEFNNLDYNTNYFVAYTYLSENVAQEELQTDTYKSTSTTYINTRSVTTLMFPTAFFTKL